MEYLWSDKKRTLFGLPISFTKYALNEEREQNEKIYRLF